MHTAYVYYIYYKYKHATKSKEIIMKSLYAILVRGSMFYVEGNISPENCTRIELIANEFKSSQTDCKMLCQEFIDLVKQLLDITLIQNPVQFVFRIK